MLVRGAICDLSSDFISSLKGKKKKRKPGEGIDTGGKRQFISDSISKLR